jgi:hypothetical protein
MAALNPGAGQTLLMNVNEPCLQCKQGRQDPRLQRRSKCCCSVRRSTAAGEESLQMAAGAAGRGRGGQLRQPAARQ